MVWDITQERKLRKIVAVFSPDQERSLSIAELEFVSSA